MKDYFVETRKRPRIIFVFLSGETKQLPLLGNYWALLSTYGNRIYATESTCLETKMATCFNDLKDRKMKKALTDERENISRRKGIVQR